MLDKKDLEQIKNIVKEATKNLATKKSVKNIVDEKIDDFARIVARSFDKVEGDISGIKGEITEIKGTINYMNANLKQVKEDVEEMKEHFVYRHELEDAESRIKLCEVKLGIESGK